MKNYIALRRQLVCDYEISKVNGPKCPGFKADMVDVLSDAEDYRLRFKYILSKLAAMAEVAKDQPISREKLLDLIDLVSA